VCDFVFQVLYGETPCNPMNSILDLTEFGKLGHSLKGVVTIVDSTYATPYLQKPIKHGVDISIHSASVGLFLIKSFFQ